MSFRIDDLFSGDTIDTKKRGNYANRCVDQCGRYTCGRPAWLYVRKSFETADAGFINSSMRDQCYFHRDIRGNGRYAECSRKFDQQR